MSSRLLKITAQEILDSRGIPTIEACVVLESGHQGIASVPSGASTGSFEALEKRDKDQKRYHGRGVLKVVQSIEGEISSVLKGFDVLDQKSLDECLINLDGTSDKSRLGANALLATSLAAARAASNFLDIPLYRHLGGAQAATLPRPLINVLNGGAHADNLLDIQEFMIVPHKALSFSEMIQKSCEIFYTLKFLLKERGHSINVGDEGGFAPQISSTCEALDLLMEAFEKSGHTDFSLALDVAASELFKDGFYHLEGQIYSSSQMIQFYQELVKNYPIISIEDGLSEEDWSGWWELTQALGKKVQLVGDDLFVTNKSRLERGINAGCGNAILIKPNQIGTLSETLETIGVAKEKGYKTVISHRSGETEDTFIADLAVGINAGQIKTGSLSRTDRLCKYNRLFKIGREMGGLNDPLV